MGDLFRAALIALLQLHPVCTSCPERSLRLRNYFIYKKKQSRYLAQEVAGSSNVISHRRDLYFSRSLMLTNYNLQ
ncbi:uncharacterized protein V1513DRAFT_442883 [Lipomyces chichibuensis]|uniref:uncharacterized protein n=1 Tax=Lipomyces chichibuensis TaxID=1546026 RepID=UPI003343C24B